MQIKDLEPFLPEMITLPRGWFVMGSRKPRRYSDESQSHAVQISYELSLGRHQITFDQWDACVKDGGTIHKPDDEGWGRGSRPVINVSCDDIQLYLSWLSKVTGKTYRFLSEAEWEYAARAGSQTAYSFGNDAKKLGRYAWFEENSGGKTHPVGEKLPNAFGLHDMHGNVWEWTADCYNENYEWTAGRDNENYDSTADCDNENYGSAPTDGSAWTRGDCSLRVARGGSWFDYPQALRSAFRYGESAAYRYFNFGFRVARTD